MRTTNPFVICKAAAGSGKTFTLVKEYLKLAIAGPESLITSNFRGILAITFTNKAANEMKERIMDYMNEIAEEGAGSAMGSMLLAEMNAMPCHKASPLDEAALKRRVATLRSTILHHYSDLSVMTIDSFNHRIVRTFAHDLGQPVNFEVETDEKNLIEQTVDQLMAQIGSENGLLQLLEDFSMSKMRDGTGYNVEPAITNMAKELLNEDTDEWMDRMKNLTIENFEEIRKRCLAGIQESAESMQMAGEEALKLISESGLTADDFHKKTNGPYGFFAKLAEGKKANITDTLKKAFGEAGGTIDLANAACKGAARASVEAITEDLAGFYRKAKEALLKHDTLKVLAGNLYSMSLMGELRKLMHECEHDSEVLHISEFNKLINNIIKDEPTPFIYERLGSRYHHLLIDEFQDTSELQWHNLVPLIEEGVGSGEMSLVVGDGKQAIYRFRQGNVEQFMRLPEVEGMELHGRTLSMAGNYRNDTIDVNFRSRAPIVEFNNDFFRWAVENRYGDNQRVRELYLGKDWPAGAGEELRPELNQKVCPKYEGKNEGYVKVFFEPDDNKDHHKAMHERALEIIHDLTQNHGYDYGDILVLACKNSHLSEFGAYLSANEVPQTSSESFYLRNSAAAMAVMAALRCLRDPRDRVACVELLHRLESLDIIGENHDSEVRAADFNLQQVLAKEGIEGFDPDYLRALDLYDCCEELVHRLKLSDKDPLCVSSLLNRVAARTARHKQDVGGFLDWFEENVKLSAANVSKGAVQLMTIHKAKGLAAPAVICLFFNDTKQTNPKWMDVPAGLMEGDPLPKAFVSLSNAEGTLFESQKETEEQLSELDNLNVLYVSMTRPKEQLFIVCAEPTDKTKPKMYSALLRDYLAGHDYPALNNPDTMHRHETVEPDEVLTSVTHSNWQRRVKFASTAEQSAVSLRSPKVRFGIYAHELLSYITHADTVGTALERFKASHILDDNDIQSLEALAHEVVENPDTARFFDPRYTVKNETWMITPGADGTVDADHKESERPDRVVFTPDEVWVVDYKTGDENDSYYNQVRGYCERIKTMGHSTVRGFLLYTKPRIHVVEVTV